MSLRVQFLGSSSGGNCALIASAGTRILLDAGFSGRQIEQRLARVGCGLKDIEAVFLTHEHMDHAQGLRGLSRQAHLQFFANRGTAQAAQRGLSRPLAWKIFSTGDAFRFRDLTIQTFGLPHDAYDPVGFIIESGIEGDLFNPVRRLAWVTDLGYVPPDLGERVRGVDLLLLEANHEVEWLMQHPERPYALKQRISGRHGHLSNAAAVEFLRAVEQPAWREVYLGHLSRDCNSVEQVQKCVNGSAGRYRVNVLDPTSHAPVTCELGGW